MPDPFLAGTMLGAAAVVDEIDDGADGVSAEDEVSGQGSAAYADNAVLSA